MPEVSTKIIEHARDAAKAAKREAHQKLAVMRNPPPEYVNMPEPTGDAERDSAADLDEVQRGFRKRAADESRRFAVVTDSEFWGALCFVTREQRDAFFAALKVQDLGNGGRYFDGNAIAERLGITLPAASLASTASKKLDPLWVGLARE